VTMEDRIKAYVELIGASQSAERRILKIWGEYSSIIPVAGNANVFVSQQVNDDNQVSYGSLWFYHDNFAGECRNFLYKDDYDCLAAPTVNYWQMRKESYDLTGEPTTDSKLSLDWANGATRGSMRALGDNCRELLKFHREFIVPRFDAAGALHAAPDAHVDIR